MGGRVVEGTGLENRRGGDATVGSNPTPSAISVPVRTEDIGHRSYRIDRLQPRAERVVEGLQGFLLQVEVSEIVLHEGDESNTVVDLLDADGLAGEDR